MAETTALVMVLLGVCLVVVVGVLARARVQIAEIQARSEAQGGARKGSGR